VWIGQVVGWASILSTDFFSRPIGVYVLTHLGAVVEAGEVHAEALGAAEDDLARQLVLQQAGQGAVEARGDLVVLGRWRHGPPQQLVREPARRLHPWVLPADARVQAEHRRVALVW